MGGMFSSCKDQPTFHIKTKCNCKKLIINLSSIRSKEEMDIALEKIKEIIKQNSLKEMG